MNQQELSHTLRKEIISQGRSVQILASGYSMFPFLRKGDLLTVEPVPMETIKRGDIVVFEMGEKWIAHRVINIKRESNKLNFIPRGDTNLFCDLMVSKINYVGKIQKISRGENNIRLTTQKRKLWTASILNLGLSYNKIIIKCLYLSKVGNRIITSTN